MFSVLPIACPFRATIVPEIIRLICQHRNIGESEALDMFYKSATGASYADDETGLYGQSALYVYGLFDKEMKEKQFYNSNLPFR